MSKTEKRYVIMHNDMLKDTTHFYLVDSMKNKSTIEDLGRIQFQNGPVKLKGKNGASMVDVLSAYIDRLSKLNEDHEDKHNSKALRHLLLARIELIERHKDRSKRDVEGTNDD